MSSRIEFCGVPGSGKSALCAGAIRLARGRGCAAISRGELVARQVKRRDFGWIANTAAAAVPGWRAAFLGLAHGLEDWIRFVSRHPEFAAQAQAWIAEPGRRESWRRAVFHAVLTTAFEFELAAGAAGPVWLDEGFAQRFFSLRGYGVAARPGDAETYAQWMPPPSALVWVCTPPEVCLARVKQRAKPLLLLKDEPESVWPARFAEGAELFQALAEALERRGVPVLRIAGEGDERAVAARIADFAEKAT